jgi:hypothetical protein
MTVPPEYARDFVGYGSDPPHPQWPEQARVAVSIVLNFGLLSKICG